MKGRSNKVVGMIRQVLSQRAWFNYCLDFCLILGGIRCAITGKTYIAVICLCSEVFSWGISIYLSLKTNGNEKKVAE